MNPMFILYSLLIIFALCIILPYALVFILRKALRHMDFSFAIKTFNVYADIRMKVQILSQFINSISVQITKVAVTKDKGLFRLLIHLEKLILTCETNQISLVPLPIGADKSKVDEILSRNLATLLKSVSFFNNLVEKLQAEEEVSKPKGKSKSDKGFEASPPPRRSISEPREPFLKFVVKLLVKLGVLVMLRILRLEIDEIIIKVNRKELADAPFPHDEKPILKAHLKEISVKNIFGAVQNQGNTSSETFFGRMML